jgi:hypothetical protein
MAVDTTEPKPHSSGDAAFHILIDHSEYWLRNNGDLAMLAVTLQRIKERWPRSRIGVLTDAPLVLHGYFAEAEAITVAAAHPWAAPTRAERLAARLGWTARHCVAARQDLAAREGSGSVSPAASRICRSAQPEATWGCDELGKGLRLSGLGGRSAGRVSRSSARRWVSDRC